MTRPLPKLTPDDVARFWSYVIRRSDPDACWPWVMAVNADGYGWVKIQGQSYLSPRVAYAISNGVDPLDKKVLHTCDNPACCNPNHFFLGTDDGNAKDRESKGRGKKGKFDRQRAEALGRQGFTRGEIAAVLKCHRITVQRHLNGRYG